MNTIAVYLIFVAVCAALYWTVISSRNRPLFLLLFSCLFVASLGAHMLVFFLLNIGAVYYAAMVMGDRRLAKRVVLTVVLICLVGGLCFFKFIAGQSGQATRPGALFPIGLSYVTFRLIHYMIESYRMSAPRSSFIDFAAYVLFFPTFLAGPVERFERFHPQTAAAAAPSFEDINAGSMRILIGLVRKFIVADTLARIVLPVLNAPGSYGRGALIGAVYGVAIQIYMDFSGYTDIALGVARLFGYRIMENFNRPFLQENIALFWRNWHISVYTWIRDYFFLPVFGAHASRFTVFAGIFATMLVFHLWHGFTPDFLVLALYHGTGLSVWQAYRMLQRRFPSRRLCLAGRFGAYAAVATTFTFVSIGKVIFAAGASQAVAVLSRLAFVT